MEKVSIFMALNKSTFSWLIFAMLVAFLPLVSLADSNVGNLNWSSYEGSTFTKENGVIRQTLLPEGEYSGAVHAFVDGWVLNQEYRFSAEVEAPLINMAYLEVKLYKNGKEIKRFSSPVNKSQSQTLSIDFYTMDADKVQFLCRIVRHDSFIGKEAAYRNIQLVEVDAQGAPGSADPVSQETDVDAPVDTQMADFQWRAANGSTFFETEGTVYQTLENAGSMHGIVSTYVTDWENDKEYEFSCEIDVPLPDMAYIEVKLYKDGKELKRFSSKRNEYPSQSLAVKFNTQDADTVQLLCRVINDDEFVGKEVVYKSFYFGSPEGAPLREGSESSFDDADAPTAKVEIVPGFEVCSIYYNDCSATDYDEISGQLFYRKKGSDDWMPSLDPVYVRHEKSLRGSLFKLHEDTDYEVKLIVDDAGIHEEIIREFKTKGLEVPIAKTVVLTSESMENGWEAESGTADGYVRYVSEPGVVLDAGKSPEAAIILKNKSYIIFEGLTLKGGLKHGFDLLDSHHIRIINCDISGYGRVGIRNEFDGKYYVGQSALWNDAGIYINNCNNILAERNYIHDPDGFGNSWLYSHPAGPTGMYIRNASEFTLRYNDIVGSDLKRWNDGVAGSENFKPDGGFKRDAEICGNYFALGNDDALELDGGQMNARFFQNLVDGFFCGVSVAACIRGPSYLYQNEFRNPGDEFYLRGDGIKFINGLTLMWGPVYLLENRVEWNAGITYPKIVEQETPLLLIYARGNEFDVSEPYTSNHSKNFYVDIDDNDKSVVGLPEMPQALPGRPTSLRLSKNEVFFEQLDDQVQSEEIQVTIAAPDVEESFRVLQPTATTHFTVEPSSGTLKAGHPLTLTVSSNPSGVDNARRHAGAFIVKLGNGYSMPVYVVTDTRKNPALLAQARESATFGVVQKNEDDSMDLIFDVPSKGKYYLFVKPTKDSSSRGLMGVDGSDKKPQTLHNPHYAEEPWVSVREIIAPVSSPPVPIELDAGRHVFHIERMGGYKMPDYLACALTEDINTFLWAPDDIASNATDGSLNQATSDK